MSTIESALADVSKLSDYRGAPVLAVAAALTNAGDGLSKAQSVTPVELNLGDTVYVLCEAVVQKHRHEPIDKDNPGGALRLVLVLKAGTTTLLDSAIAKSHVDAQAEKIRRAEDAANNRVPLPDEGTIHVPDSGAPAIPPTAETDEEGYYDPATAAATAATPIGKARAARKAKG